MNLDFIYSCLLTHPCPSFIEGLSPEKYSLSSLPTGISDTNQEENRLSFCLTTALLFWLPWLPLLPF